MILKPYKNEKDFEQAFIQAYNDMNDYSDSLVDLDEEMKGTIEGLNEILQEEPTQERMYSVQVILDYLANRREYVNDIQKFLVKAEIRIKPYLEEFRYSDELFERTRSILLIQLENAVKLLDYNATKCVIYIKKYEEEFSL